MTVEMACNGCLSSPTYFYVNLLLKNFDEHDKWGVVARLMAAFHRSGAKNGHSLG